MTVRRDALICTDPDEALLWITLSALEDALCRALADVSTRSKAIVAILDALSVAKADRSTSGVSVQEEFDYTGEARRSLGHRDSSGMAVRLAAAQAARKARAYAAGVGAELGSLIRLSETEVPPPMRAGGLSTLAATGDPESFDRGRRA